MSANQAPVGQRFATAMRLADAGLPAAAETELLALAAEFPALLPLRHALVRVRLLQRNADAALAIAAHPPLLDDKALLAAVVAEFGAAGANAQRAQLLRLAMRRHPHDHDIAVALAAAAHGLHRPCEAIRCSEHALRLRPEARIPREIRAAALVDRGDVEAGLAAYREVGVDDPASAARHLVLAHYDPAQDCDTLFAAIEHYARRHLPPPEQLAPHAARATPRRRRVGWVSPRFAAGPVATFLHGMLAQFDRERHEHVLVALQPVGDEDGRALLRLADEAVDASGLDDALLLQRLRGLRLDVLVDLAGHSSANRMAVLARRAAPLQLCWLDWFDSTGVAAIDAWISDRWLTPEDSRQRYSERVVRLATGRFCYSPPASAPPPTRVGDDGPVFASFNRLAKLNDGVVDAWANILRAVPDARLSLRARHLGEAETRAHVATRFAARGIAPERLELGGHLAYADLLEAYRGVDVALDPFPFSGCTTTCDALWMGCAVVALAGTSFVARQAASLLWRLDRDEWVVADPAAYVECAIALAARTPELRRDRAALREAMRLRLCDARAQALDFERVFDERLARQAQPQPGT